MRTVVRGGTAAFGETFLGVLELVLTGSLISCPTVDSRDPRYSPMFQSNLPPARRKFDPADDSRRRFVMDLGVRFDEFMHDFFDLRSA